MGVALITDLSGLPVTYFLAPALAATALLLLTGLALEAKKHYVSETGCSLQQGMKSGHVDWQGV